MDAEILKTQLEPRLRREGFNLVAKMPVARTMTNIAVSMRETAVQEYLAFEVMRRAKVIISNRDDEHFSLIRLLGNSAAAGEIQVFAACPVFAR